MCLGKVRLHVRSHVVFDENVLHAERGVVIVKAKRGGEGDVVVESVGFRHLSSDFVRRFLALFFQDKWYFVVEKPSSFFAVNPHFGKSLISEESIVIYLHGFSGIGILWLVYGDDDVGDALDFFVEIFKGFHAEGANSAPCAGAFFDDLCARIEHIVFGIGMRFYCCRWGRCCCRCATLCCGSATHDGGK